MVSESPSGLGVRTPSFFCRAPTFGRKHPPPGPRGQTVLCWPKPTLHGGRSPLRAKTKMAQPQTRFCRHALHQGPKVRGKRGYHRGNKTHPKLIPVRSPPPMLLAPQRKFPLLESTIGAWGEKNQQKETSRSGGRPFGISIYPPIAFTHGFPMFFPLNFEAP